MGHYGKYGFTAYPIKLKANGKFIGFVGLMVPSFEVHFTPAVEIGWRLGSQH
jgi:RimJ/RimL family protein N-acetyltransferase